MKYNLTQKIIKEHLVSGTLKAGEPVFIKIDQTLTQDSTGTMAYLQLEALNIDKVKTERSIAYIDHNMLQSGFENADDHAYIQSVALSKGVYVSKPGNGICHQVHLERFSVPSKTLTGSDSHTPTCGAVGMLAIGVGGLDVALNMAGGSLHLIMPKVVNIELKGKLNAYATAKDVILEVLKQLSVKGGVGKVMEYTGEGVKSLSVFERATITNMGAELGATTSIFASDEITHEFLKTQGREKDFIQIAADEGASYDEHIIIDLSQIKPLAACPHSPDNVKPVSELKGMKIDQVCIGSCTDSSLLTMLKVAAILKGKRVHAQVSLTVNPGSRQVLTMLSKSGALADILGAGARLMECACGPCIGLGQSPKSNAVSLRTFNRNFYARSGTKSADVYLVSPLTAAFSAIEGKFCDPADFDCPVNINLPKEFEINDNLILNPADFNDIQIVRGPNIKPFPIGGKLENEIKGEVLIVCPDNITTDHIMPSDAKLLPFRSNIPYLSDYCLNTVDENFSARAKKAGGGFIVAGANYGQGSSREHAALVPKYLNIKAVLALSFARIHKDNLVNNGIIPLTFINPLDMEYALMGANLQLLDVLSSVKSKKIIVKNLDTKKEFEMALELSPYQSEILIAGGALNLVKNK